MEMTKGRVVGNKSDYLKWEIEIKTDLDYLKDDF